MNTHRADVAATFDGSALRRNLEAAMGAPFSELGFANAVTRWQQDEVGNAAALDIALRYAAWGALYPPAAEAGPLPEPPLLPPLDAAILFAPVGALVPAALRAVARGATVVCAGIHMSDIPAFPYALLWGERSVRSVANLTRRDGEEFMALASRAHLRTSVHRYALAQANEALRDLRKGAFEGAAVLTTIR